MTEIRRIGFIGIGRMGWPMAARLIEAGYDLVVCDAVPKRATDFAAQIGGRAAQTSRDAVAGVDAIITMLHNATVERTCAGCR